jgi:hypothetical protein
MYFVFTEFSDDEGNLFQAETYKVSVMSVALTNIDIFVFIYWVYPIYKYEDIYICIVFSILYCSSWRIKVD